MAEPKDVLKGFGLFVAILAALYCFLVGLDLLGSAFKVIAGDSAGSLFSAVDNPIAGLMVGILATVLVQSSSTTTSIIVSAVGAGVLPVQTGIPMIFGANIGTSVTNTIVSLGFVGDREQYRRGFSGATVHDMFNYMNVAFWLPLELLSSAMNGGDGGILFLISEAITDNFDPCEDDDCEAWEGPLKIVTAKVSKAILDADKDVSKDFAFGRPDGTDEQCELLCNKLSDPADAANGCPYKFNQKRCATSPLASNSSQCSAGDKKAKASFTWCVNSTFDESLAPVLEAAQEHYDGYILNKAGVFHDAGLDQEGGWITLVLSLIILMCSLVGMVKLLGIATRGPAEEFLKKALNMNGYLAILVGTGITIFVQSSSITTSTLTPLVAIGTLTLEGMLPLTLGANIGTTVTGILAALVSSSVLGFQIALVHVFFNVFGVILFYPIPFVRAIPIRAARNLGDLAATFKAFPIIYIIILFLVIPGYFLAMSVAFEAGGGGIAGGIFMVLAFIGVVAGARFWYTKKGGREYLAEKWGHDFENEAAAAKLSGVAPASA